MIDGNISMEEDTELRDLVVQTLENNGVLAKVRAELRASVFLTLEEQESVLNSEPFLNKSVKEYLSSAEGKLLFSLVREFLEYFGLDYTISVYDPETYFGKEYNYVGRKKLCEELGINSKEPLLGEILKNSINSALNNRQKGDSSNIKQDTSKDTINDFANATFDIRSPKVLQKDSTSISVDTSENSESLCDSNLQVPINVTITDKKQNCNFTENTTMKSLVHDASKSLCDETIEKNLQNVSLESTANQSSKEVETNMHIIQNNSLTNQVEQHQNQEISKNKINLTEFQNINNTKNRKQSDTVNKVGKTIYYDQIIVDGVKEKVTETENSQLLLGELPPLLSSNNSVFSDLPPLNGKKADMSGLKELMDIAQGVSEYEEDFTSSTSGSINEQSPLKVQFTPDSTRKMSATQPDSIHSIESEIENEEINKA